jgi:Flp pilus assembly protein TadG
MSRRRQDGQSLVEVALVLPILVLILLGVFDFGRAVFAFNTVENAAREAARVAIVDQKTSLVEAEGKQAAIGLPPAAVDVAFSITGTGCGAAVLIGCTANITVDHEWRAITPIIGGLIGPIQLSSTTAMPIERVYTSP